MWRKIMAKTVKKWEVCYDVEFHRDYVYIQVEADDEEEAIDKVTKAEIHQAAEECSPEVSQTYLSHAELVDEYEVEDEDE
jgi:hypothetical protein